MESSNEIRTVSRDDEGVGWRDEPVAGRDEPVAGRDEPVAGRDEPVAGRDEPVAGRDEPVAGRDEPVAGRDELASVDLSAGTIRYRDRGSGMPIVFVHGLLVNGLIWRKVVPLLEGEARCIVPDWPLGSHTISMKPDADLTPRGVAHLIAEFLEALDLRDVVVVANDTGGALAQILVTERPERVARLLLTPCDAFENFPPKMFRPLVLAAAAPAGLAAALAPMRVRAARRAPMAYGWLSKRAVPDDVTDAWIGPALANADVRRDAARFLRALDTEVTLAAAERLHTFTGPVLLAWASEDRFFPLDHARRLATLFPNARLVEVEDSRTFVSEDRPDRLAELIRELMAPH
jgi:pimeloyl-ACP methyl ester carboxylesterase